MIRYPARQRAVLVSRKRTVDVLSVGNVAGKIKEPVQVNDWHTYRHASSRFVQTGIEHTPDDFHAVYFITMHACGKCEYRTIFIAPRNIDRGIDDRMGWQPRNVYVYFAEFARHDLLTGNYNFLQIVDFRLRVDFILLDLILRRFDLKILKNFACYIYLRGSLDAFKTWR